MNTIEERRIQDLAPDFCLARVVVFGCGNILLGDDGFGPAVSDKLAAEPDLPPDCLVMTVHTGVRSMLFDIILCDKRPERIVIVDAADCGWTPGTVCEIEPDQLPAVKTHDFSLHQAPTCNLLKEVSEACGVEVKVVACQVEEFPDEVMEGLSSPVAKALDEAVRRVKSLLLTTEDSVKDSTTV